MKLLDRWTGYWFRPAPLVNLAVSRIVIVAAQLAHLAAQDAAAQVARFASRQTVQYDPLPLLQLLLWPFGGAAPPPAFFQAVCWVMWIAGGCALVGWKTRWSLSLFAVSNLVVAGARYSFGGMLHHYDALMMIALVVLALSPAGAALSVDALRRGRSPHQTVPYWPLLLIQWVMALVYLSSALDKLAAAGLDWMNGYTLQYYLCEKGLLWGRPLGEWLGRHHALVGILSWLTILFEGTFFLAVFLPKLMPVYLVVGAAFHIGVWVTMGPDFSQYLALYAVFIPWLHVWQMAKARPAGGLQPEVLYDSRCGLCLRTIALLRAADRLSRLRFSPLEERVPQLQSKHPDLSLEACRRDMRVVMPDGAIHAGFFAYRVLLRRLPVLWLLLPLFYMPLASRFGPRIYAAIAATRLRFAPCSDDACAIRPAAARGDIR